MQWRRPRTRLRGRGCVGDHQRGTAGAVPTACLWLVPRTVPRHPPSTSKGRPKCVRDAVEWQLESMQWPRLRVQPGSFQSSGGMRARLC
eukprot:3007286-Pleurochrysis_carterae.AAC.2